MCDRLRKLFSDDATAWLVARLRSMLADAEHDPVRLRKTVKQLIHDVQAQPIDHAPIRRRPRRVRELVDA